MSVNDVNSATDKILYNIQVALTNQNKILKEQNIKVEVTNDSGESNPDSEGTTT